MRDRAWVVSIAVIVLALDQITKLMVLRWVPLYSNIPVIDGFLSLTHVRNSGAAFGLFNDAPAGPVRLALVAVSVLAVVLIWAYAREGWHDPVVVVAFGLILGGALGNLSDRLRLHNVVDFIDVYWGQYHWPSFNVADTAITLGALTLFIGMARHRETDETAVAASPAANDEGARRQASTKERPAEDAAGLQ